MTKLQPQLLSFSGSSSIIGDLSGKMCVSEGSAATREPLSKRSALSASDAECFSLCLGAGPLWEPLSKRSALSTSDAECFSLCLGLCGGPDVPAHSSAPPGGVSGGASSPATPSTPTHDDNNCDLLSALLCSSKSSLSGSAETLVSNANSLVGTPPVHTAEREEIIGKIVERKEKSPVKIDFKIYLTENTASRWEAVVQGSTLYLRLPGVLSSGSKESFMVLLDFAEERLGCESCVLCVRKSRTDRAQLLRTFMFMGFSILPPNAPQLPCDAAPDYVYLYYNMQ